MWTKNNKTDKIWWKITDTKGDFIFSFDKKTEFNIYLDFPYKLTKEQVKIFINENPFWAEYFEDRLELWK